MPAVVAQDLPLQWNQPPCTRDGWTSTRRKLDEHEGTGDVRPCGHAKALGILQRLRHFSLGMTGTITVQ
jgi:hypothetical protein